jgi:hypothetical protein
MHLFMLLLLLSAANSRGIAAASLPTGIPALAPPAKTNDEFVMKIRDYACESGVAEQELRRRWTGIRYCSFNKNKRVLRIGFTSQEALSSARSCMDAATLLLEPRTDETHDETFVVQDFAERGFQSFLLSVSPMTRGRFLVRFVHADIAAAAAQYINMHRLFHVRGRPGGAADPTAARRA